MLEARLLDLLEREPTRAMPLDRLHGLLAAEVGAGAAGYSRLRRAVESRPDTFVLLEPATPFDVGLTDEMRAAYTGAVEAARLAPAARVALAVRERPGSPDRPGGVRRAGCRTEDGDEDGIGCPADARRALDRLDASLLVLWRAARGDAVLRAEVAAAITQADELRRRLGRRGSQPAD